MYEIDANVIDVEKLQLRLTEKRIGQLKAFYAIKLHSEKSNSFPDLDSVVQTAIRVTGSPLWSWWLNEQTKNDFKFAAALPFSAEYTGDEMWVSGMLSWREFTAQYQAVCPVGYEVEEICPENSLKWRNILTEAFRMIRYTYPEIFEEMKVLLKAVIPLKALPGVYPSFSFSSQNRLGAVFFTYSNNLRVVVDNIIHEYYHNRLNLLIDNYRIMANDIAEEYYSVWRKKERPLIGILHGTFASLGIVNFWYRYVSGSEHGANDAERESIISSIIKMSVAIKLGIKALEKYAVVQAAGESLMEEMKRKSEIIFDWACKNNSALVGKHYRDYVADFDHWKAGSLKPELFFDNIF